VINTKPTPNGIQQTVTVNLNIEQNLRYFANRGFSLIELMIALAIGSLIALAISILFFQVFSGFRTTDDAARAVEGGKFGLRVLTEDLRMAGFVGLFNDPARVELARTDMISSASADNCGNNTLWPFQLINTATNQLGFIEQIATPSSLPCISATGFVAGSPALVIRRASGMQATAADLTTNNLFIQSSQSGAIIFMGKDYATNVKAADRHLKVCSYQASGAACTNVGACKCPTTGVNAGKGVVTLADAPIFQYLAYVYYIRPCSRPAGATCAATDDEGAPIPTLVRRQLSNTDPAVFIETPIAEGVERMTLAYGIDSNDDGVPDSYSSAPANIGNAMTVRLSLLLRTRKIDNNFTDTSTYTLADGTNYQCATAVPAVSCKLQRFLVSDTIQLKNYAIRR
jgi:type IV pilus assembly protein PilW